MKPVSYVMATLFVGLTFATAAQAGERPRQRPTFEQLDKNSDGKIVATEVPARGWQRLSRADTNKDNAVTKAEFDALRASRPGGGAGQARPTFEQLDKNSDGKIVATEVPARGWQRLSRADTNKDNAVTKAEFDALRASRPGGGGAGKARPTFEQLDKNSDGKIVATEVPAWGWQRLSRADTNKDNAVTKAEFDALRASRPGRAGQGRR